jgi:osmotically inducible lipoprotein OsmB
MKKLLAAAALLALAACGTTPQDRALSGGALGAGAGALGSAVIGGSPLTGALLGGALGAAGGALTDSRDVDLGRPIWRDGRDYRRDRWYEGRRY